jgi:hypothetical protein
MKLQATKVPCTSQRRILFITRVRERMCTANAHHDLGRSPLVLQSPPFLVFSIFLVDFLLAFSLIWFSCFFSSDFQFFRFVFLKLFYKKIKFEQFLKIAKISILFRFKFCLDLNFCSSLNFVRIQNCSSSKFCSNPKKNQIHKLFDFEIVQIQNMLKFKKFKFKSCSISKVYEFKNVQI